MAKVSGARLREPGVRVADRVATRGATTRVAEGPEVCGVFLKDRQSCKRDPNKEQCAMTLARERDQANAEGGQRMHRRAGGGAEGENAQVRSVKGQPVFQSRDQGEVTNTCNSPDLVKGRPQRGSWQGLQVNRKRCPEEGQGGCCNCPCPRSIKEGGGRTTRGSTPRRESDESPRRAPRLERNRTPSSVRGTQRWEEPRKERRSTRAEYFNTNNKRSRREVVYGSDFIWSRGREERYRTETSKSGAEPRPDGRPLVCQGHPGPW